MRMYIAVCTLLVAGVALAKTHEPRVVGYFGSWAVDREGEGKYNVSNIDPTLFTHLIYAFLDVNDCGSIRVQEEKRDLSRDGGYGGIEKFVALRELSPSTKFMVSVGGWENNSPKYSKVIGTPALRATFVQSALGFLLQHGLDGLDIYWAYPAEEDKQNFICLLRELRALFDKHNLILSAALLAAEDPAKKAYDIPGVAEHLDFIDLLAFEFHGSWDKVTGNNAPLEPSRRDVTPYEQTLNIEESLKFWVAQGIPAEKLNLGLAFYGKCFTVENPELHAPGSPITGPGKAGRYTQTPGDLAYFEICQNIVNEGWTPVWDAEQDTAYAYGGDQWCSYDNDWSLPWKTDMLKRYGLGGAMIWNIDMDDFIGICGHKNALLKQVNHQLRNPDL